MSLRVTACIQDCTPKGTILSVHSYPVSSDHVTGSCGSQRMHIVGFYLFSYLSAVFCFTSASLHTAGPGILAALHFSRWGWKGHTSKSWITCTYFCEMSCTASLWWWVVHRSLGGELRGTWCFPTSLLRYLLKNSFLQHCSEWVKPYCFWSILNLLGRSVQNNCQK